MLVLVRRPGALRFRRLATRCRRSASNSARRWPVLAFAAVWNSTSASPARCCGKRIRPRSQWPGRRAGRRLNEYDADGILHHYQHRRSPPARRTSPVCMRLANTNTATGNCFSGMPSRSCAWCRGDRPCMPSNRGAPFATAARWIDAHRRHPRVAGVSPFPPGGPIGCAVMSVLGAGENARSNSIGASRTHHCRSLSSNGRITLDAFNATSQFEARPETTARSKPSAARP